MKVQDPSGREYYLHRAPDDRDRYWSPGVMPIILEFNGERAEAYAEPERSGWIFIRFRGVIYCHSATLAGGFYLLSETSLNITDPGGDEGERLSTIAERMQYGEEYVTISPPPAEKNSQPPGEANRRQSGHMGAPDAQETDAAQNFTGRAYRKRTSADSKKNDMRGAESKDRPLTRRDLEAVVSHLPALRDAINARNAEKAAAHNYSNEFRTVVRAIVNEFYTRPFMYAFDYLSWMDEARRFTDDPQALASADLETIRKILVVHWRSDYWDSTHEFWEHIAASGHLTALLERVEEIATGMEMEPTHEIDMPKLQQDSDTEGFESSGSSQPIVCKQSPSRRQKWTHDLRVRLYSRLLREFGPYASWGKVAFPEGRKGELEEVLRQLAVEFADETGKRFEWTALEQQMRWGITRQGKVKNSGFAYQYILNKAAAIESGFLSSSDLSGFVHFDESEPVPGDFQAGERDASNDAEQILLADLQDFIVYHNPDAMGPLEPGDNFGVVTNRGLGSATIGDRVWLITGEGTPRKFFLASWFYIDEFSSGEDNGFKHAIVGKNGQNFDPFIEIEQDEWFTQLKQDQGNFAFGFSRINTPGAADGLKQLAGFNDRYHNVPNPAGKVDRIGESAARAIEKIVRWIPEIKRAVEPSSGNDLDTRLSGLLVDLDAADLSLKDPDGTWLTYAFAYATGHSELPKGDLHALRAAFTWHTARPRDFDYWREIAMNGQLMLLLQGFEDCLRFHCGKDLPAGSDDPEKFMASQVNREVPPMAAGSTSDASGLPTKEQYIGGLRMIRDKVTEKQMMLLRTHYHSAFHTATMTELAEAAGFPNYSAANMQYGLFARKLMEAIGLPAPTHGGHQLWMNALAYGIDRTKFGLSMQIVMWPDFASALKELEMV